MTVKCLNEKDQKQIVATYAAKLKTQKELAEDYGVSVDTIYRVIKRAKGTKIAVPEIKVKPRALPAPIKIEVKVKEPELIWNANSKFISITQGRETWNADADHKGFAAALTLLATTAGLPFDEAQELVAKARDIINVERAVTKFVDGNIRIEDGFLYYQDIEIRSGLVDRIIESMNNGENFKFYLPFLENLLENPSRKAVDRLFDFLVANDIEITEDGHFIGWKVVRENYFDCHTGTMDNSPGKIVKMPRTRVNDNDRETCSAGLHVCSKSYIRHFGGRSSKLVSVKVHPRDVVSIPVDYGDAKMRSCQYEVLADVTHQFKEELESGFRI